MVRTYVRKTEKGAGSAYTVEDFQRAIDDVRNGNKTTRGAALFYNIPRSTLKHHVLGTRGKGSTSKEGRGGGGVTSYLSTAEEEEIANCIKVMEKHGFGLSREDVLDLVQMYIRQNNLPTRFKDQRPGTDWFISFKKRQHLSIKKPQSIEYVRCDQVNPWVIYDFFDKLEHLMKDLKLEGKPGQIFNCDETSFCHDPSKTKIVGAIGARCQRKTSSSGRENTSVLLCCSADGRTLPLLCVFKGKFVMENWINEELATQTAVSVTERGWMETTLFYNWFRDVFLANIGRERPVILIYDGHVTHISVKLIQLARANDIIIMKLPPHTTHVLQPLDVAIFKGLKTAWDKALCKWQRQNPRKKIPKAEFTTILTKLSGEIPEESIKNGFKATGIYDPCKDGPNREAIPVSVFKPEDLKKYRKKSLAPSDTQVEATLSTSSAQDSEVPVTSTEQQTNIASTSHPQVLLNEQPSTSKAFFNVPAETQNHEDEQPNTYTNEPTNLRNDENSKELETPIRKSFEDVLLDLFNKDTKANPERKRKRLVTNCEIITTAGYLQKKEQDELEKQENLKKKKQKQVERGTTRKQKNLKKRKPNSEKKNEEHSSNEESNYSLHESDDSLELSDSEKETNADNLSPDDFAVFKVFGKDKVSFRLYVGRIQEADDNGYQVKFFKRRGHNMQFTETEEESYVQQSELCRKLSEPLKHTSSRYNNMLHFSTYLEDLTNLLN
ncbi:uncharacterized protein [Onthophagus taurus]|uniref:uncharacterized protein n=1 Tax=Onthophagus taurus TaxID=166361 RepID=UPI0039BE95DF